MKIQFNLWFLFLLIGIVAFSLTIIRVYTHNFTEPWDSVVVNYAGKIPDTEYRCLLVEVNGTMRPMYWYRIGPGHHFFLTHPDDSLGSSGPVLPNERNPTRAQWIESDRYGLLTRSTDGVWRVWWMDRSDIIVSKPWFDQNVATINVDSKNSYEYPSRKWLRSMGFKYAIRSQEEFADAN